MDNIDFLVVQEMFLTAAARRANVVLPALSFAERDGTYTSGDRRVQRFNKALPSLGQGRADWAILADVAGRLGAAWDYSSAASVLTAINKAVPTYAEMTPEALQTTEPQWPPVGYDSIHFGGTAYQNDGGLGLRSPAAAEAPGARLAFDWIELPALHNDELTAVPVTRLYRQGTLINRSSILENRRHGSVAEFHPADAEHLGIRQGALVTASLGGRTFELSAQLNSHMPEGTVLVPNHLPAGPITVTVKAEIQTAG
jgi:NADH-quinone oxidoreductase subunit G